MKIVKPYSLFKLVGIAIFAFVGIASVGAEPEAADPESDNAQVDPLAEYDLVENKDHPGFVARVYKWTKDIARFDAGLRALAEKADLPEKEDLKKRMETSTGEVEVITDGYGGVVDFNAAKGTVQYEVTKKFGGKSVDWEFELAKDTKIYWDKSTALHPKITRPTRDGRDSEQPIFGIHIAKASAGPFKAGDRVRFKASIDDFSRFRKNYTRATGLVAIYFLEDSPNPLFQLRLHEAEITLLEPNTAEQGAAGRPATRSESDPMASDKPQLESEARSR